MHENIPITFKGVSEPYAKISFVDFLLSHFTCFFFIMFHVHWSITLHEAPESISISITTPATSSATCPFSSCDRLKTYSGLSSIDRLFLCTANLFLDTPRMASKMILLRLSWNKLCFANSFKITPKATESAMSLFGWTIWIFSHVIKFTTSITSRFATVTLLVVPVFCFRKIDSKRCDRCPLHLLNLYGYRFHCSTQVLGHG